MKAGDEQTGRQRLIDAALLMAAERRSLSGLGIRELTREAGLSPASFYRHFVDLEELGVAVIDSVAITLREAMSGVWGQLRSSHGLVSLSLATYFRLVDEHPNAFIVSARERYGACDVWRTAVRGLQTDLSRELARELALTELFSAVSLAELEAASMDVIELVNVRMLDVVASSKSERASLIKETEQAVQRVFGGVLLHHRLEATA